MPPELILQSLEMLRPASRAVSQVQWFVGWSRPDANIREREYGWRRSANRTRLQANSLLTGNLTGNFAISGPEDRISEQEIAVLQRFLSHFPTKLNRENIRENRELKNQEQGINLQKGQTLSGQQMANRSFAQSKRKPDRAVFMTCSEYMRSPGRGIGSCPEVACLAPSMARRLARSNSIVPRHLRKRRGSRSWVRNRRECPSASRG
jgi:hypothetical protein